MSTIPKPFVALTAATLLCALAWLAQGWAASGLQQTQAAQRQLEQAQAQFATLQRQMEIWQTLEQRPLARVEPVALQANFAPQELVRMPQLLAGLYADRGHFELDRFALSWGDDGQAASLQMEVQGNKVFITRALEAPNPPGPGAPVAAAAATGGR